MREHVRSNHWQAFSSSIISTPISSICPESVLFKNMLTIPSGSTGIENNFLTTNFAIALSIKFFTTKPKRPRATRYVIRKTEPDNLACNHTSFAAGMAFLPSDAHQEPIRRYLVGSSKPNSIYYAPYRSTSKEN